MSFILSQLMGFFALGIVSIGYFLKDRKKFLITQISVNFFYALAFLFSATYVGATIMFISSARCLYLLICEAKNFKHTFLFLNVFPVLYLIALVIFFVSWIDIFPAIACIIFTYGFKFKRVEFGRIFFIFACLILVAYNILSTTYISAVSDFLEALVIFFSIIKFAHDNKKQNENPDLVLIKKISK